MKSTILTLKLTLSERERLRALTAHREEELASLTGQRIEVSASAYIRWLMDQRALAVGLASTPTTTKAKPTPKAAKANPAAQAPLDVDGIRAEASRLIKGGVTTGAKLAKAAGLDGGQFSRFRRGESVGAPKLAALEAACRKLAK